MGRKLYVGNLSYDVDSSSLQEMFAQHGTVESAEIISDRETGRSKGFGFVQMGSDAEAASAISAMNGQEYGGRPSPSTRPSRARIVPAPVAAVVGTAVVVVAAAVAVVATAGAAGAAAAVAAVVATAVAAAGGRSGGAGGAGGGRRY